MTLGYRTTNIRSAPEIKPARSHVPRYMTKLEPSPLNRRQAPVNLLETPSRRVFLRPTLDAPLSDSLNVLSDEECEEPNDKERKTIRYPLPTMPLSIMCPVTSYPSYIKPIPLESIVGRVSRVDSKIANLLDSRDRLVSSYTIFDTLCSTFQGEDNLSTFLRSLSEMPKQQKPAEVKNNRSEQLDDQRCDGQLHCSQPVKIKTIISRLKVIICVEPLETGFSFV